MNADEITSLFLYFAPTPGEAADHAMVKAAALNFARYVYEFTPNSAEQTLAIRAIHLAMMHASSAIAIHRTNARHHADPRGIIAEKAEVVPLGRPVITPTVGTPPQGPDVPPEWWELV